MEIIDPLIVVKFIVLLSLPFIALYTLSVYGRRLAKKKPDHLLVRKVTRKDLAVLFFTAVGGLFIVSVLDFTPVITVEPLFSHWYGWVAILILFTGIFFGTLTLHASEYASKNGEKHTNITVTLIHLGSIISMYAITVWGFIYFAWWVPLAGIIVIYQALRLVVRNSNWKLFYRAIPLTGGLTIAITCGAWILWALV